MKFRPGLVQQLLCGVLLALCTTAALPQAASLYTVEIVVFRNGGDIGALPEVTAPVADGALDNAVDGVDAMPVATSKLNSAATRLAGKAGLQVLAHVAWTQSPTAYKSLQGASAAQLGLGDSLTGKVFLYQGKYLDLGVDFTLQADGRRYRINELHDKIKLEQILYFDHPAIGVLAIVSRVSG